jgi:tetratricopeptide (TPR) repeat protein
MADCQSHSLLITGLRPGRLYALAISSWSHVGESDFSREKLFVYDNGLGRPAAHLAKGSQLMREGHFTEAHAYITAAIRLDPRLADAYRVRAALNEHLKQPELARQDYAKAEKLFNGDRISLRRSTN